MSHQINHANIKEWAKAYDGEPFDAILCDPPYELGFMGKSWDSTGISNDAEMWAELLRICKPGAFLLAFSGSRTYHRMACAIEDAGFEIRDMIEWVYGSGFPKSLDIGKAVDKLQGNEREDLGVKESSSYPDSDGVAHYKNRKQSEGTQVATGGMPRITKGDSLHEGYGTALKPAHEPICMARKPFEGTVAGNVLEHGTGGINIDGCRVEAEIIQTNRYEPRKDKTWFQNSQAGNEYASSTHKGRFPANLIHDGSDEAEAVFPERPRATKGNGQRGTGGIWVKGTDPSVLPVGMQYGDTGSAARFFYCAKANKSERNAGAENRHPTVKPLALTKYLATLIKPPTGGRLLVPFSGSGSEMIGALQAGWEHVEGVELTEEYIPIALARIDYWLANQPLTMFAT